MSRFAAIPYWVLAGPLVAALLAGDGLAGTGSVVALPPPGTKTTSGLVVQIDTRWLDGSGYRPVRVRVSPIPAGPALADRSIRITLRPRGWRTNTRRNTVTSTIELPQGARLAQETVSIPHHEGWSTIDVQVHEGGVLLEDLSARNLTIPRRSYYEWTESLPSILFIDSDVPVWPPNAGLRTLPPPAAGEAPVNKLPDLRGIAGRLPTLSWNAVDQFSFDLSKTTEDRETLRLLRDLPRFDIVSPADLPDSWVDLTCVDIAFITRADLELLSSVYPEKWEALRSWAATGPILCVAGVALHDEGLTELEAKVGVRPLATADRQLRGWSVPAKRDYSDHIVALESLSTSLSPRFRNPAALTTSDEPARKARPREPADPQPFLWRGLGSGYLVALRDEQPFPGEPQGWCWLLNSLSAGNWMWYRRHGFSMYRENPDYWKLLIPDVGEAPVNSFLLLISLFVIVIGPLNYFVLQRIGRLYLLLVTVPVGASVVTCGLLAYALLTDGLAVRARVRSVTEIDQSAGRAVAWSRQTYYAGMAPAGGIAFPRDAAVYPVEFRPQSRFIPTDRRWHTVWDARQRLIAGFLPSRTTTQFLVVESRQTRARLDLHAMEDGSLQATNRLGTELLQLLVRDAAGDYYAGTRLAAGASATLRRVAPEEESRPWNVVFARNMPRYPEDFDPYQMENAAQIFPQMNFSSSNIDGSLAKPTFDSSIFEKRLQAVLRQDFRNLQPRSYLAIVESSPEVSLGTDQAQQQSSLHALLGRW